MNFWKRFRWISSGLLISLWLIAVLASGGLSETAEPSKATACTTNCL